MKVSVKDQIVYRALRTIETIDSLRMPKAFNMKAERELFRRELAHSIAYGNAMQSPSLFLHAAGDEQTCYRSQIN